VAGEAGRVRASAPVDVLAVTDVVDMDGVLIMIDFADDSIVADPETIGFFSLQSEKEMLRIFSRVVQFSEYALLQASGQSAE